MVLEAIRFEPPSDGKPSKLQILDQLLLPHREHYIPISSASDGWSAIKAMKVRGAPAIAIVAALSLAVEISALRTAHKLSSVAEEVKVFIEEKLNYLVTSRPTAVNLADAVGKLKAMIGKEVAKGNTVNGDQVAQSYEQAAEKMLEDDVADNEHIGEHGAEWIKQNTTAGKKGTQMKVLTHCNTGSLATAGYGTALGVVRSLYAAKLLGHAFCTETRPYNQGSRLTAFELVHDKIPATLITDSMAAALLAKEGESLAAIVVGADRVAANGDTANKIGTYSLAVLARHHGVKFLVAAPRTTIDRKTARGADIVIEERAKSEVTTIRGPRVEGDDIRAEKPETVSIAAMGIDVWNPAFDVTPASLIDGVITEKGVVEKSSDGSFSFDHIFEQ